MIIYYPEPFNLGLRPWFDMEVTLDTLMAEEEETCVREMKGAVSDSSQPIGIFLNHGIVLIEC